ncbi:uncharacterized protein LY89DRAFT_461305 [Mollisia scopiformis]|uniref:Uncharacterized protein n=1 Tax=Mollisia scopiformis TaxID=149040 RepID=A0A194XHU5_MOLSC|nr:uncharacterized protein LY89DRAFT_461305 [Mollisia scopiformis]KUJ19790.1 hypothetical protein LY89DRAFT_461305 [Mollisia scopiformis]
MEPCRPRRRRTAILIAVVSRYADEARAKKNRGRTSSALVLRRVVFNCAIFQEQSSLLEYGVAVALAGLKLLQKFWLTLILAAARSASSYVLGTEIEYAYIYSETFLMVLPMVACDESVVERRSGLSSMWRAEDARLA